MAVEIDEITRANNLRFVTFKLEMYGKKYSEDYCFVLTKLEIQLDFFFESAPKINKNDVSFF